MNKNLLRNLILKLDKIHKKKLDKEAERIEEDKAINDYVQKIKKAARNY